MTELLNRLSVLAAVTAILASTGHAQEPAQPVDFSEQVLPILSDKCFVCHGPDAKSDTDLRLDSYEAATKDLLAIDPDDLAESALLDRIHSEGDPMPPESAEKQLTDAEKDLLSRWVKQGANYESHWAFVVPKKAEKLNGLRSVIDSAIETRLAESNTDFNPPAEPATLARRAALVLTGLPPEPAQLKSFLAQANSGDLNLAYANLVDELLASPRFGEHQARYWLDAVRYGDTHGLHLDNRRGIYPYRDWVVKALNENLPFDQFVTWQLAGDLLPNPTLEQLTATGFVRMNPTTAEGGAIPEEFQAKNNFDRTENFGTVFLGLSMTCARCHTHKYDPITQEEYYRLFAFFNSTAEHSMDGNKYVHGDHAKVPKDQNAWARWDVLEESRERLLVLAAESDRISGLSAKEKEEWKNQDPNGRLKMFARIQSKEGRTDPQLFAKAIYDAIVRAEESFTTTLVAKELPKPRVTKILQRGEYNLPIGEPLSPGVIAAISPYPDGAPKNRLGLAKWLVSKENPLTSRVLVNQIWQRVFGIGLVRTPEDFGVQGQHPTHPELLDWLAVEFQDSGWDYKKMVRMMVMSRTFRQSSAIRKTKQQSELSDPENLLFSRGPSYRLDAEVLRDLGLWASELLDPTMGGEGVKPYQPAGMWKAMSHPASNTKNYVQDSGTRLYRRSLYVYWKRTSPHPMMTLFDAPSRESSCMRREATNTSLQSLALLNETQRIEMARSLGLRLIKAEKKDNDRLDLIFNLLACRTPNDIEREACNDLVKAMRKRYTDDKAAAEALLRTGEIGWDKKIDVTEQAVWTQVCATILASDIAITLY